MSSCKEPGGRILDRDAHMGPPMLIWGGQITAFEKHERITNRYDGQGSAGCGAGGGITS